MAVLPCWKMAARCRELCGGCRVAQDNSLLVTTATCGGVLLAANWMRTLQNLQARPCACPLTCLVCILQRAQPCALAVAAESCCQRMPSKAGPEMQRR